MARVWSGDTEIAYEAVGQGPPVVLLHPFPVSHEFWLPAAQPLLSRYRLILPDLRGHGDSRAGEGPAVMAKHADDLIRVLDDAGIQRAVFVGVSIGGYALFEFWRRSRSRVVALALFNTKAKADTPEAKAARLQSAAEVSEKGTESFFEGMKQKLMGKSTLSTRPDLVEGALRMMRKMSPKDVAAVQEGMALRQDSVEILPTINVPTQIVTGDEDILTGIAEAELMHKHIRGSDLKVIAKAGHYSPWEQPEDAGLLLRQYLDGVHGA